MIENSNRINIKEISIKDEHVKNNTFFDPSEYVLDKDIGFLKELMTKTSNDWLQNMFNLKQIWPNEFSKLLTEKDITRMTDKIIRLSNGKDIRKISSTIAKSILIAPDRRSEFELDNRLWAKMRRNLDAIRGDERKSNGNYLAFFNAYADLKIINPGKSDDIKIDNGSKAKLKQYLSILRENEDMHSYFQLASRMRIALPNDSSIYYPTEENWKNVKELLKKRKDYYLNYKAPWMYADAPKQLAKFYNTVSAISILSADSLEITDRDGLKLQYDMQPIPTVEYPPVPVMRRF